MLRVHDGLSSRECMMLHARTDPLTRGAVARAVREAASFATPAPPGRVRPRPRKPRQQVPDGLDPYIYILRYACILSDAPL
eukprot:2620932-Rhodomonas_salina.2